MLRRPSHEPGLGVRHERSRRPVRRSGRRSRTASRTRGTAAAPWRTRSGAPCSLCLQRRCARSAGTSRTEALSSGRACSLPVGSSRSPHQWRHRRGFQLLIAVLDEAPSPRIVFADATSGARKRGPGNQPAVAPGWANSQNDARASSRRTVAQRPRSPPPSSYRSPVTCPDCPPTRPSLCVATATMDSVCDGARCLGDDDEYVRLYALTRR